MTEGLATLEKTDGDIALFAAVSGDVNPIHLDERLAEASPLRRVVGQSLWGGGLISGLLGRSGSPAPRWRPMASSRPPATPSTPTAAFMSSVNAALGDARPMSALGPRLGPPLCCPVRAR